jgi:hypothetical protein
MADKPILFSGEMVRAILADEKGCTRRLYKLPKGMVWYDALGGEQEGWYSSEDHANNGWWHVEEERASVAVGDTLWVKETFAAFCHDDYDPENTALYCAEKIVTEGIIRHRGKQIGEATKRHPLLCYYQATCTQPHPNHKKWHPSIHMPRWASRITLNVTGVRIEKLQDMNRGDAMAEGCPFPNMAKGPNPLDWFRELWDGINGAGSWDANPWVWVYEFERVEQS